MSDTAIFITIASDELNNNGQLPGDLRSLRNLTNSDERVVHFEVVADSPLPEKTLNALHMAGAGVNILPSATDTSASLVGGLMARLHEFICAYPHVGQFILAGADVDRLASASAFLQRAGFYVVVSGPDRSRLDALRPMCDDVATWSGSGRQSDRQSGRDRGRDKEQDREETSSKSELDPYEVLVDEVAKGRKKGNRVLLTSLKQRIRRRIRRFDETRLKDKDGRPIRKFKDFVVDAANRGLIQLIEKGNASHVLLPDEEIPEDNGEETGGSENDNGEGSSQKKSRAPRRKSRGEVDPLLDSVDMVEGDGNQEDEEEEDEDEEPAELTEDDFEVDELDEEADPPPGEFMEMLQNIIPEDGLTLPNLLKKIAEKQKSDELEATNRQVRDHLQSAYFNELLETVNDDQPAKYVVVEDWQDIIDFL